MLEVVKAAGGGDRANGQVGFPQSGGDEFQAGLADGLGDGAAAELSKPEIGETARHVEVADDVRDVDRTVCVLGNEPQRLFHQVGGGGQRGGRFTFDNRLFAADGVATRTVAFP